MTHSIRLLIKTKDYKIVKEIEELVSSSQGLEQYKLKKTGFSYSNSGMHPFIYFPEENEDKNNEDEYTIQFESGSHCCVTDTPFSTYIAMFFHILLYELDSQMIEDFDYIIWDENDDTTYKNINEFWKDILEHDEILKKELK